MPPKTKSLSILLQLSLSPVLLIFASTVSAQAPPTLRRRSAFTSYNNQFYIHGGILPTVKTGSNEFNSLNLATSWSATTATTAPWTTLPAGNQVWHHAIVAIEPRFSAGLGTGTQGYILAVAGTPLNGPGYWTAYDIQSKQWRTIAASPADTSFTPYIELEGHTATVDPSTGLVYVIGGFNGLISNAPLPGGVNLLTVFDPKTATILSQEQATTGTSLTGANAVWSTKRGTVLLLGGSRAVATISVTGLDMTVLTEYNPTSKQWTSMRTSGVIPPARLDACAVVTDDGSKVIVYGGAANANTYLSSIYILDLTTGVWTAGPPTTGVLSQATCAYNAGQLIVFAGSISATDMNSLAGATPLVFDVNKGAWVTSFTASSGSGGGNGSGGNSGSGSLTTPTHPIGSGGDGPGDGNATGGKSHMGAIIGAITGVLVLLLIGLAVYLVRMRRRRNLKKVQDTEAKAAALLAAEEKDDKKKNEPKIMTAADHYAAAQAALEEASKRIRPSAFKSPKSWTSEANSYSVSDGNSTAVSKARRLSDPEVKADPALYYQQLLLKQRQLQRQHPHLIGGLTSRSPHSNAGGGHLGVSGDDRESDCSSNKSGSSSGTRNSSDSIHERRQKHRSQDQANDSKKRGLAIQTRQVWVPPQGVKELIISPSPSSPQDWGNTNNNNSSIVDSIVNKSDNNSSIVDSINKSDNNSNDTTTNNSIVDKSSSTTNNNDNTNSDNNNNNNNDNGNSIVNNQSLARSLTHKISTWDLQPSPTTVRSPHTIVSDLKVEHVLTPRPSFAFSSEPSSLPSSHNFSSLSTASPQPPSI